MTGYSAWQSAAFGVLVFGIGGVFAVLAWIAFAAFVDWLRGE